MFPDTRIRFKRFCLTSHFRGPPAGAASGSWGVAIYGARPPMQTPEVQPSGANLRGPTFGAQPSGPNLRGPNLQGPTFGAQPPGPNFRGPLLFIIFELMNIFSKLLFLMIIFHFYFLGELSLKPRLKIVNVKEESAMVEVVFDACKQAPSNFFTPISKTFLKFSTLIKFIISFSSSNTQF